MDTLLKKMFCDESGQISITKAGASLVGIGVFIDGIPEAAAAKGIIINFHEWLKLLSFCFTHIGGAIAGLGIVDIAHKCLPKK